MHKPTKATNSRLEGHHFLVGGHCKAVGGQDLRLEAVASRWWDKQKVCVVADEEEPSEK